jgi:glycosyltransferase involved in cell wall biosynthesis
MISVLIPIYNGIEFIEESVCSVLNQTFDQWEIILGVNGHPENSEVYRIAKSYENRANPRKIRAYDLHWIQGKSNALNEMLTYCSYSYVAILDVDDIWLPTKLELQSTLIGKYDVIGTKCVYFGDLNDIVPDIPVGDLVSFNFTRFNPMINSSSVIRKELCHWKEHGAEDYEMWLRLKVAKKSFYNFPDVLVKHRIHRQSAFNTNGNIHSAKKLMDEYETVFLDKSNDEV